MAEQINYNSMSKIYSFILFLTDSTEWLVLLVKDEFFLWKLRYDLTEGSLKKAESGYKIPTLKIIAMQNKSAFEIVDNFFSLPNECSEN